MGFCAQGKLTNEDSFGSLLICNRTLNSGSLKATVLCISMSEVLQGGALPYVCISQIFRPATVSLCFKSSIILPSHSSNIHQIPI